jgi:hypothetical protein
VDFVRKLTVDNDSIGGVLSGVLVDIILLLSFNLLRNVLLQKKNVN